MSRTAGVIQAEIDQIKAANPNWTTNAGIIALITELIKEKNQLSSPAGGNVVIVQALSQERIDRIQSSVLCVSDSTGEVIATAIVWDYTLTEVLLLTNYHTWDDEEFHYCFPPREDEMKGKKKASSSNQKKGKKAKKDEDDDVEDDDVEHDQDPSVLKLHNVDEFEYEFTLTSDMFHCWEKDEDFAVLKLPRSQFTMQRIPISLSISLTLKIHAFGYVGHTKQFNITGGEVCGLVPQGFTMNLLSAGGFSGAAILADGLGRAVGYMGRNLDASSVKNSQHQLYAFTFNRVAKVTNRQTTPTNSPAGTVGKSSSR